MLNETELQEIEKRCAEATPGPWSDGVAGHAGVVHFNGDDVVYVASAKPHDRAFIIGARTDIPTLLSAVRELQRQVQEREADARRLDWVFRKLGRERLAMIFGTDYAHPSNDVQMMIDNGHLREEIDAVLNTEHTG